MEYYAAYHFFLNQCICVKKECINYYDDAQVGRLICPTPALLVIASINTHMQ